MQNTEGNKLYSNLIAEYEDVIHSMQIQLEVTQQDHKNLKEELFQLVSENQKLSSKLDLEYKQRISESTQNSFSEVFHSELVTNLEKQLDLCKKEKNKLQELYETSLLLIEKLEHEAMQQRDSISASDQSKVSNLDKSILEAKLKTAKEHLEIALNGRDQFENENVMHKTEIAKLKMNLEASNKLLDDLKLKELEWKDKYTKSQQDYMLLSATYECVVQSRNDLEKKIDILSSHIQELMEKNDESKSKVAEALDVAEKAIVEKDSVILRERQLSEELGRLQLCLEHVIEEAGKKVAAEIEQTEKKYEVTLNNLLKESSEAKNESEKAKQELKKISFKYKKLEKQISAKLDKEKISLIKGSEAEITILENQLDFAYKELEKIKLKYDEVLVSKKKSEEKLEELFEKHKILAENKEKKENYLEGVVKDLKLRIEEKVDELNESSKRCEFFLSEVKGLQEKNKNLKKISLNCKCEKLKAKIKKLNEIRVSQMSELESHVESQMKLNETWKTEIREITEKFEEKIREIRKECDELRAKNKKITLELNAARQNNCLEI